MKIPWVLLDRAACQLPSSQIHIALSQGWRNGSGKVHSCMTDLHALFIENSMFLTRIRRALVIEHTWTKIQPVIYM